MVASYTEFREVNVLANQADWAWPEAIRDIFMPRNVNLLMADTVNDFVNIIEQKRIHTAILDLDSEKTNAFTAIRIIRMNNPRLPCIMLTKDAGQGVLSNALQLDVFSVIDKPVDLRLLQKQLNRLFIKKYDCNIFSLEKSL